LVILIRPSLRKLEKLASTGAFDNKTILHYTGDMFGIGCKVSSYEAIERIQKLKGRSNKHSFILLVSSLQWFEKEGIYIPDRLIPLLKQYWPGNLTVIFKCDDERFAHIAVNGKVAFRVPDDELLRVFIDILEEPIISTSVNISSLPPESDLKRLTTYYADWFDYAILPGNKNYPYNSQPSTIVEYISSREENNQSGFDELKCIREGSIPFYAVKKSFEKPTILFVCTANICRSPIAEKLFNHYASRINLPYSADSAGLLPGGQSISTASMQLLLERGILEARDHISKQITPEMIQGSYLVLTMEERQRDFLRMQEPKQIRKIFTLNEYIGETGDIADPFGADLDTYRETFNIIDDRIQRLIEKLKDTNFIEKDES